MITNDKITENIIACCFKVHSNLGPGFNEKIYHNALVLALKEENRKYETEKEFKVYFNEKKVGSLKMDLIVEDKVIVEIKALTGYMPEIFKHQILSYLKVAKLNVGLLINFGNSSCQIKRYVL